MVLRTRFAPSPTGYMHIGNLRTALYSYLIAKRNNGKFILRIEDTDKNRYVNDAIDIIYNTLSNTKLVHDEGPDIGGNYGPYIQSERLKIYKEYAELLVKTGHAYYCFCPEAKTDLDTYREEINYTTGIGYNKHCRNLTEKEIDDNLKNNVPYCIRQKIEEDIDVEYTDAVYGKIVINSNMLDDQVLLKQDGYPTYNFANVIDDHLMGITHIVRGNEYISSTPKYILLYKAFGWNIPEFIHLPLINGKDENGNISKLSKRHGAVSFDELVKQGYLPEAIINYIAFLGWNPKTNQEIFSLDELAKVFDIKHINKADTLFDYKKLEWFNAYYIKQLTEDDFYKKGLQYLGKNSKLFDWKRTSIYIKEKISKFSDLNNELKFLIDIENYNIELFENKKNKVTLNDVIPFIDYMLNILNMYSEQNIITKNDYELIMRKYAADNNVKFGFPMWIFRIALSGLQNTIIGGLEIAEIIGINEVKNRLNYAKEKINNG